MQFTPGGGHDANASIVRARTAASERYGQQWQDRSHLIGTVHRAPLKGYPPQRWPPEQRPGISRSELGLQLLFSGDSSMMHSLDPYRATSVDGPKTAARLDMGQLLSAFKVAPWQTEAPQSPIDRTKRRGRSRPNAGGRPMTAAPSTANRRGQAAERPTTAPPRATNHRLTLLATAVHEDEVANLIKKSDPALPTQHLCRAILMLVQRCADSEVLTWSSFQQWVRRQNGAEAAVNSLKQFRPSSVPTVVAEQTIQYLIRNRLYPELFQHGAMHYKAGNLAKLAPLLCQWAWDAAQSALSLVKRTHRIQTPLKSLSVTQTPPPR